MSSQTFRLRSIPSSNTPQEATNIHLHRRQVMRIPDEIWYQVCSALHHARMMLLQISLAANYMRAAAAFIRHMLEAAFSGVHSQAWGSSCGSRMQFSPLLLVLWRRGTELQQQSPTASSNGLSKSLCTAACMLLNNA